MVLPRIGARPWQLPSPYSKVRRLCQQRWPSTRLSGSLGRVWVFRHRHFLQRQWVAAGFVFPVSWSYIHACRLPGLQSPRVVMGVNCRFLFALTWLPRRPPLPRTPPPALVLLRGGRESHVPAATTNLFKCFNKSAELWILRLIIPRPHGPQAGRLSSMLLDNHPLC